MIKHHKRFVGAMFLTAIGGCSSYQRIQNSPPEAVSSTPLTVDAAMQLRNWDRSTARYANGDTIAGPTGFNYEPKWYQEPESKYYYLDLPLALGQTLMLPVNLIVTPPWEPVRYTGSTVDPSYTLMPALPGESTGSEYIVQPAPAEETPLPAAPPIQP